MITPEPPAGSEHYREGWRHGYEQAAIDRERAADAPLDEAVFHVRSQMADDPYAAEVTVETADLRTLLAVAEAWWAPRHPGVGWADLPATVRDDYVQTAREWINAAQAVAGPSGDPAQAPDLAYARSEVDKWLADDSPYCILPTRTEHIPALLARLDELERSGEHPKDVKTRGA